MTILITGGTGFVGLGLAERIVAEGDDVILFGIAPPPDYLRSRLPGDRVRVAVGDVRSATDIRSACCDAAIDMVIHMAAVTAGPVKERSNPEQILSVNVEGTAVILKTLASGVPPRRIVIASSGAAYGFAAAGGDGRLSETMTCPAPAGLYGISKLAGEQVALRLGEIYGLDVRVVRLGTVYGPWEYPTGVREVMSPQRQILQCVATGRAAILPRAMPSDWIYVRDVARGIMAVARARELEPRLLNLGGSAIFDLLDWCGAVSSRRPGFTWRLAAPGEEANIRCNPPNDRAPLDNRLVAQSMGFQPDFDLATAVDDYLGWLESLPAALWRDA
jgi:nucleoside-diphosphate-sugar epimerase